MLEQQLLEGLQKTNIEQQGKQVEQLRKMYEAAPAASGVEAQKAF
jgi:hypothetical protein